MSKTAERQNLKLTQVPRYSVAEAARLTGVAPTTARRWLHEMPCPAQVAGVSFLELLYLSVRRKLVEAGVSAAMLRECQGDLSESLGDTQPFLVAGRPDVDTESLIASERLVGLLRKAAATFDYGPRYPVRWWPRGRGGGVVIDPNYGSGRPVVAGSGVRTEILFEQFTGGEGISQIASDFNLSFEEVERALQFEARVLAAA